MKVVVTGASGHLGGYVVERLAETGWDVVAASRSGALPRTPPGTRALRGAVRSLALDVAHDSAVSTLQAELGPEVALVHLAGWVPPSTADSSAADRRALVETNVLGTQRVLEAARRSSGGCACVVYASSFEVYGLPRGTPVGEDAPLYPISDYGATKLSGEDHLFAFADEESVRVVALRLPAVYGPGERVARALPNFLRAVARGERPRIHGDGGDLRDQIHARDAARAIELALRADRSGTFNASDGSPHSVLELARTALALAGSSEQPEMLPRSKPRYDFHMSIERLRGELGFAPEIGLEQGMQEELAWLRDELRG